MSCKGKIDIIEFNFVAATSYTIASHCNCTYYKVLVLQVVWAGTTKVGAALKKVTDSQGVTATYVVARYSPHGNTWGQYEDNVKPLCKYWYFNNSGTLVRGK